jgi:hypothetical protein
VIPGLQRREVGGYSFFAFFLSCDALWGLGIFGKHLPVGQWNCFWLDSCAGVGSCRVSELGRESRFGPLTSP